MTVPGNLSSPLLATAADTAAAAANITKSLRFNSGDSAYLSRTPSSASNRRTWTWAGWVKLSKVPSAQGAFFNAKTGSGNANTGIDYDSSGPIRFIIWNGSSTDANLTPTQVFRDFSAWQHLCVSVDTTQATAANRVKMYINGSQITDFSTEQYPSQNYQAAVNLAQEHYIGRNAGNGVAYLDACLADVYFIDGSQLEPTSFGAYDDNGVWQAATYSGTFGTNGFHLLDFANESTVGHDSSGNNNDFTANNILENDNEAADFNAALSSTPFSDGSASSISITNTGSISTSSAGSNSFSISNAAEFTGGSNSGLTLGSAVDRTGLYTLDMYFKLDNLDQQMRLLTNESTTTGNALGAKEQGIAVATDGSLNVYDYGDPQLAPASAISANTWYHYRLIADGTTIKASYLNGTAQTTSGSIKNFAANTALRIGYGSTSVSHSTDGLIGPIRIVPGNLGAPPSGGLSTTSGALSNSASAINLSPGVDVLFDVPTNGTQSDTGAGGEVSGNYCCWNPLAKGSNMVLKNGNLDIDTTTGKSAVLGTIGMSSGKWYWETTINGSSDRTMVGIGKQGIDLSDAPGQGDALGWGYYADGGNKLNDGTSTSYGAGFSGGGDVIGCAFDADNGTLTFYKNGTSQGTAFTGLTDGPYFPATGDASSVNNADSSVNFGQRAWAYSAPSNHKALCTTNLPTPTIADGSAHFDVKLYTGNGSTNTITGLEFSPDFTWIKKRNATSSYSMHDTVRGATKRVRSESSDAETTETTALTAFTSDGFTLGSGGTANANNDTFVSWNWNAGSSTVSNTDGSITSSVRASQTSGFSIATYTGNATSGATIGHGLSGAAPELIFIKRRNGIKDWIVYHSALGNSAYLRLNTDSAESTGSLVWAQTDPTSSVFSIGGSSSNNASGGTYVAYCFAPVAGFSAFGKHTGTGAGSTGPFNYCGFRPALVAVKRTDSSGWWSVWDTKRNPDNAAGKNVWWNDTYYEIDSSQYKIDILSNGFRMRSGHAERNASGGTYIWLAFAENPFQANGGLAR